MITAQRIAHGEFAAGATVVRVVSRCCGACSAPHCWRCRGAAHMWRIRRQPDLVQCLGRRVWLAAQLGPLCPLSLCPTVRIPRALAFGALFALRLCRAVRAALAASLYCYCCRMQRAVCHLPPAHCKQLRSAIFVCVFKFFINPKNNDRNFRLATFPLPLLSPAASCPLTHTLIQLQHPHTHPHIHEICKQFSIKNQFYASTATKCQTVVVAVIAVIVVVVAAARRG